MLILIWIVMAIGVFIFYFLQAATVHFSVQHLQKPEVSMANNETKSSGNPTNITDQSVEFYKVITDPKTGQYAAVDSDKEAVSLKDKAGKTIWEKISKWNSPRSIPLF